MSGTEIAMVVPAEQSSTAQVAYQPTRPLRDVRIPHIVLRRCYALSGTDVGYQVGTPQPWWRVDLQVASCLRICYAMPGTDIAYAGVAVPCDTSHAMSGTDKECAGTTVGEEYSGGPPACEERLLSGQVRGPIFLRFCAMSGTDLAYVGTTISPCPRCTMSGTEEAYGATVIGLSVRYAMPDIEVAYGATRLESAEVYVGNSPNHAGP
eukprot:1791222-Rhodomonas_salina.7